MRVAVYLMDMVMDSDVLVKRLKLKYRKLDKTLTAFLKLYYRLNDRRMVLPRFNPKTHLMDPLENMVSVGETMRTSSIRPFVEHFDPNQGDPMVKAHFMFKEGGTVPYDYTGHVDLIDQHDMPRITNSLRFNIDDMGRLYTLLLDDYSYYTKFEKEIREAQKLDVHKKDDLDFIRYHIALKMIEVRRRLEEFVAEMRFGAVSMEMKSFRWEKVGSPDSKYDTEMAVLIGRGHLVFSREANSETEGGVTKDSSFRNIADRDLVEQGTNLDLRTPDKDLGPAGTGHQGAAGIGARGAGETRGHADATTGLHPIMGQEGGMLGRTRGHADATTGLHPEGHMGQVEPATPGSLVDSGATHGATVSLPTRSGHSDLHPMDMDELAHLRFDGASHKEDPSRRGSKFIPMLIKSHPEVTRLDNLLTKINTLLDNSKRCEENSHLIFEFLMESGKFIVEKNLFPVFLSFLK